MIRLVKPTPAYKEQVLAYKKEFEESLDHTDGTSALDAAESFESWYQDLQDMSCQKTVPPGLVPASQFLGVDEKGSLVAC